MLFADVAPADPLAMWGGLILQGGAFGLLTYIVVVFAPRVMRDAREERESRDKAFSSTIDALQTRFEARNQEVITSIKEQTQILATALNSSSSRIESSVSNICKSKSS